MERRSDRQILPRTLCPRMLLESASGSYPQSRQLTFRGQKHTSYSTLGQRWDSGSQDSRLRSGRETQWLHNVATGTNFKRQREVSESPMSAKQREEKKTVPYLLLSSKLIHLPIIQARHPNSTILFQKNLSRACALCSGHMFTHT